MRAFERDTVFTIHWEQTVKPESNWEQTMSRQTKAKQDEWMLLFQVRDGRLLMGKFGLSSNNHHQIRGGSTGTTGVGMDFYHNDDELQQLRFGADVSTIPEPEAYKTLTLTTANRGHGAELGSV